MRRILIDDHYIDPKYCQYDMPWDSDSLCYNFKIPDELVLSSEIENIGDKADIHTLVIGCELESYDFISEMVNLKYLYIYKGGNVTSLDFVENLVSLDHFYIVESHISDIGPLISLLKKKETLMANERDLFKRIFYMLNGICIKSDCDIAYCDINEVYRSRSFGSDLIINGKLFEPHD